MYDATHGGGKTAPPSCGSSVLLNHSRLVSCVNRRRSRPNTFRQRTQTFKKAYSVDMSAMAKITLWLSWKCKCWCGYTAEQWCRAEDWSHNSSMSMRNSSCVHQLFCWLFGPMIFLLGSWSRAYLGSQYVEPWIIYDPIHQLRIILTLGTFQN